MTNQLQSYKGYQKSGIEWLGDIPEHWSVRRGKSLFRCIDQRSTTGDEELLTVSSNRGVVPRRSATVTMFKAESYVGYKLCWPGDLVINSLWAWARGLGVSRYHGIISTAYGVYRPIEEMDAGFAHELVRSTPFNWELKVRSKGVWTSRLQLTDNSFLTAPFPVPPLDEQRAIVRYLDYMDRRIRRYIRAKQKLIKLLAEQKQAMIHQVVTRGLDPSVRLRPSGVEWLGDVPIHWEVRSLGNLIDMITGYPFRSEGFTQDPQDIRLLRGVNVAVGQLRWEDTVYWPSSENKTLAQFELLPDDVVLGMDRPIIKGGIRIAKITPRDVPSLLLQRVARLRSRAGLHQDYLVALLGGKSFQDYLSPIFTGISVPHLSPNQIKQFLLTLPPVEEQVQILSHIRSIAAQFDVAIRSYHELLQLMQEYQTRLTSDMITGKLDVREAAKSIPEELEDSSLDGDESAEQNELEVDIADGDLESAEIE